VAVFEAAEAAAVGLEGLNLGSSLLSAGKAASKACFGRADRPEKPPMAEKQRVARLPVKRQSESSPTICGVPALKLVVFKAPSV
jgi:hypothetical protein